LPSTALAFIQNHRNHESVNHQTPIGRPPAHALLALGETPRDRAGI
jgi:hypothetical protein